ncbi:methionine-gamma-lyase [Oikeobacillus pervagus]|uniref:L-methionine gamma-lyase n=1 Tax=Oikeobacillus pervagus TaxID=1325931 RepID=A0AAJ1T0L4_9BACI|nr:methionine gamma-lyase [Oikeobacillus pervagus]MDQ0215022.1 methionine-gamma-lyase [Oikeobacillus pervagus]
MSKKFQRFETKVIHQGYDSKQYSDSLTPPLFQSSTFAFANAEQGEKRFAGEEAGFIYSRLGNPTVQLLEDRIASLEEGEAGLAFASGMSAVSAVLLFLTKTGDHVLCSQGLYGCTFGLLQLIKEKYGVDHSFSMMESEEEVRKALKPETSCIYIETPINPTMRLVDLKMVVKVAKEQGIPVVVDNTFCSPYLQKPLALGCDIVLHSATKYIGGHGDVIAGIAVGKREIMDQIRVSTLKDIGGVISPFDAWLLLRGLKTLPIRMDRHCENASKIANLLKTSDMVEEVFYPGDENHPQYEIMKNQMSKGGGMISFTMKGSKEETQRFLNQLKMIKIAVSLGDAETLIQHPSTMTHSAVDEQSRKAMGIPDHLIRLSVGLEAWEDIWEDLKQALEKMKK